MRDNRIRGAREVQGLNSRRVSRRDFFRTAGALGGAVVLSGGGRGWAGAASPTGPAPAASSGSIQVGAVLELTGSTSAFGQGVHRGLQMAVEKINRTRAILGKRIELLVEDTQSDTQGTINAVNSLMLRRKVEFIIGPVGSVSANTAASAVAQYKPLWIIPGGSTSALEVRWGKEPWMFHPYPWDRDYYRATIGLLNGVKDQVRRVAIVYVNDVYGNEHIKIAEKAYKEAGYQILIAEPFQSKSADLGSLLARVKQTVPDIFHGIAQIADGVTLTKAVQEAGLKAKVYHGNNVPSLPEWLDAVGPAVAEGWLAVVPYAAGVRWPASKEYPELFPSSEAWEKEYRPRFNRIPASQDAIGYSSLVQLALALNLAGTTERQAVIKALHGLRTMTIMGPLEYRESPGGAVNSAYGDMQVTQIQGGKLVIVYPAGGANAKLKLAAI